MKHTILIVALAIFTTVVLAQDAPPPPAKEKQRPPEKEFAPDKGARERAEGIEKMMRFVEDRIAQRLAEAKREAAAKQPSNLLSRAVRLEFRAEPGGPEERPMVVRTAVDRFTLAVGLKGRGQGMNIKTTGHIQFLENNLILVVYDATMEFAGGEGGGNVSVSGGVKLVPGRPSTVASLGDRHLVLVAEYDEEPAIAEKKIDKPMPAGETAEK